jgi:hypothetical protein
MRCRIYADRPTVCQVYPVAARNGEIVEHPDSLCPDGSWPRSEIANPSWSDAVRLRDGQFELYAQAVDAWNNHVNGLNTVTAYQLQDFYSYLLRLYDRLQSNYSLQRVSRETPRGCEIIETSDPFIHQLALKVVDELGFS